MQIVPKGNKWTSAFSICGGGYLKSNHIGLLGLSRFAGEPSAAGEKPDWTTAVNIRFHRGSDTVSNILAWDRHGDSQPPCPVRAVSSTGSSTSMMSARVLHSSVCISSEALKSTDI